MNYKIKNILIFSKILKFLLKYLNMLVKILNFSYKLEINFF